MIKEKDCERFLENVLELGRQYVATGAEIKRVEDTLYRICNAYEFKGIEVYAVTSLIVITVKSKENHHYTQSVRVTEGSTDLGRLEEINAQCRYICREKPDVEELDKMIMHYQKPKGKPVLKCLGYMLAAGGFAVFFGGSLFDGFAAALVAIVIYLMDYHFKLKKMNNVVYTIVASFISGTVALLIAHFGIGDSADKIMIGDIMLFIPGLLLVNSIKEMFNRDIVTGLYRFIEAIFVAVAIAGGYALSVVCFGGVL